ncbi:MAG: transposase [Promethearchaeia archaeon]
MIFKTKPTTHLTKFINSLKGVSSRYLFQEFPEIKEKINGWAFMVSELSLGYDRSSYIRSIEKIC